MSTTLNAVWKSITSLLSDNISLIPIRDKDDGNYQAKTPFGSWAPWQKKVISKEQLWHDMDRYKTEAIGIVCGAVSGNLEGIDVDEKYMPGISARLMGDMQFLYPTLYTRLRIHGTPSGGFHIIYRCPEGIDGNMKLAGRPASQTELLARPKNKTYNFLETRGEGGYLAGPPSLGYSVVQDVPIPTLTATERATLINLCRSYTYLLPVAIKPYKATVAQNQYYDTNPFEDFNSRVDPNWLAELVGWKAYKENNKFIWYTRPGKTTGVSMSFNLERRFYFCFTASTELDEHHGYTPANLVAKLLHDNDKKKTHAWLVRNGYGRVKETVEQKKAAAAARTKTTLPANFSAEAQSALQTIRAELQQLHPYGVFWKTDPEDDQKLSISRELLYHVCHGLGFRCHREEVVRIEGQFLYRVTERQFQDVLKAYIKEPDEDIYTQIADAYEGFMQRAGKYTMQRLGLLDTATILADTPRVCYKFFTNGYLAIDETAITFLPYDTLEGMVWHEKVQPREYAQYNGGKYLDFLSRALVVPTSIEPILGYLSHEYKDETTGFIIVLTEQCPDPKMGGGSGKNIFCSLLQQTTSYHSKNAAQAKFDEKFFQTWNGQRIMAISDAPKDFDFMFLKEPSTGSFIWKKLFKDEVEVKNEDAPKFIVQTNYSYEITDGGLKRRIKPVEFTDFFTRCGGVDVHYNCHFPRGWSQQDWNGFDTYVAHCVQVWIRQERKLATSELTASGWEKQFAHTYGATAADFITQNFTAWTEAEFVPNTVWAESLTAFYRDNDIKQSYHVGSRKLYEAVEQYAHKHGWGFLNNQNGPGEHRGTKGKKFYQGAPF